MKADYRCGLHGNVLAQRDYDKIMNLVCAGGLCIIPSDSSYTLTGRLSQEGVSEDINALLERNGMKMALAFGSKEEVGKKIELSNMGYRFLSNLSPGGLTFVAKPSHIALQRMSKLKLFADGTIAVRLTESQVETQLAAGEPIPTTPIRDGGGKEVCDANEAWNIVSKRLSKIELNRNRKIAVIDGVVPFPGRLSTVVKEVRLKGCWHLQILRKGAIPVERIKNLAYECRYVDVIDET